MGACKQLVAVQALTGSAATYYTAPASPSNVQVAITSILLVNNDSSARTVTVHVVPDGGTADATNMIVPGLSLSANTYSHVWCQPAIMYLPASATIQALCSSAGKVNLAVAGEEIS